MVRPKDRLLCTHGVVSTVVLGGGVMRLIVSMLLYLVAVVLGLAAMFVWSCCPFWSGSLLVSAGVFVGLGTSMWLEGG